MRAAVRFEKGVQNAKEIDFYENHLQDEDRQYFPKLLGKGYYNGELFLIQEKVVSDTKATKADEEKLEELKAKYKLRDMWVERGYTGHHNVATTKDGMKIFDIGFHGNPTWR